MTRSVSREGVRCSATPVSGVGHVFAVATGAPAEGGVQEQTRHALQGVGQAVRDVCPAATVVRLVAFVADPSLCAPCARTVQEFYGPDAPAATYMPQPPCDGSAVVVEAWAVDADAALVERVCEHVVVVRHHGMAWAHCAGIRPQTDAAGVYDRSRNAFARMQDALGAAGFAYEQMCRTWLYLGDIVGPEGDTQRYKELNRARADVYQPLRFFPDRLWQGFRGVAYPASTGIGASDRDVTMGCVALATDRTDVTLTPLENPVQTPAFDYSARYSAKSPKFCRALAVSTGRDAVTFVSGTASIVASETQHVGDVSGQTRQTLDNIETLISEANLRDHGLPGLGATLHDLALVRAYVKRGDDCAQVAAACQERLGLAPTVYTLADVCRPELLVELEAIAFSSRS